MVRWWLYLTNKIYTTAIGCTANAGKRGRWAVAISMGGGEHGFFCAGDGCKATAPSCQSGRHMLQVQGTDLLCPVKWFNGILPSGQVRSVRRLISVSLCERELGLGASRPCGHNTRRQQHTIYVAPPQWKLRVHCASALFKQTNKK